MAQPYNQGYPPQQVHPPPKTKKYRWYHIIGLLFALAGVLLLARGCLGFGADLLAQNLPYSVDADIGEAAADEMRNKYDTAGKPSQEEVDRVERIFNELRDNMSEEDAEVLENARVTVVEDDMVNAFALPGGEVFVLTGLLDRVEDDDAQLRGVLAHELGHAVKRHGLRALARRAAFGIVLSLMVGSDDFMSTLLGSAAELDGLSHSRDMENEADVFGADLLVKCGHDVEGLAKFLESLGSQPVPELLSTHPDPAERADEIRERARQ